MSERSKAILGGALVVVGLIVTVAASVLVHMAEAPEVDKLGREMYPLIPRSWQLVTVAQSIALGGVLIAMGGAAFGFIYDRTITWARAMFGALLFAGLMFIIFAIIPNQFLTLAQATLEWTPQKVFVTIPPILVLNNEVTISYAALKDMLNAGYATTMLFVIPVVMYQWQERAKKREAPKPQPVSSYGRPLRVDR